MRGVLLPLTAVVAVMLACGNGGGSGSSLEATGMVDSVSVTEVSIRDTHGSSRYATAVVRNRARRPLSSVEVTFALYSGGVRERTVSDAVYEVGAGEAVRVEAQFYEHESIDSIAVHDVSVDL